MATTLSDDAKKVLAALSERASEGFDLSKRTGLKRDQLETAIRSLMEERLISVQGEPYGESLLKSYFWIPPQVQGKAAFYLGALTVS